VVVAVEVLVGSVSAGVALSAWAGVAVITVAAVLAVTRLVRRAGVAATRSGGSRSARTA
jgi:hypothetical protein